MSDRHVVVGAGPVGRAAAALLAERGSEVILASRSGTGAEVAGVTRATVDAASSGALGDLADGAVALYNCVNPAQYHRWATLWPPVADAFLSAARRSQALLVTAANLYPYGPVDGAMVEGMPDAGTGEKAVVRARMWAAARDGHTSGRLRAVEVRGSDYMGDGVGAGAHVPRVLPQALRGKAVRVIGSADQPHTWTDVVDMARCMVAVVDREDAWGRIWHAPSNQPRTQREAVQDVCRVMGRPPVPVRTVPGLALSALGRIAPTIGALRETAYQFERPYVMDSSAAQEQLGLAPTPWDEVCRRSGEDALRR